MMCTFSACIAFKFNKATNGQTDLKREKETKISRMSLLTIAVEKLLLTYFIQNSDIQLCVLYSFSWIISICPSVALLKATYAEYSYILFLVDIKKCSFLTSCVFCFFNFCCCLWICLCAFLKEIWVHKRFKFERDFFPFPSCSPVEILKLRVKSSVAL